MRTTMDLDPNILERLRLLKKKERKSLGSLTSTLLAEALAARDQNKKTRAPPAFAWHRAAMGAKVDLSDKEALWKALDLP